MCIRDRIKPVSGKSERTVMDQQAEIIESAKNHQTALQETGALADPCLLYTSRCV